MKLKDKIVKEATGNNAQPYVYVIKTYMLEEWITLAVAFTLQEAIHYKMGWK